MLKYCSDCKVLNEEDRTHCKICGKKLEEKPKTKIKYKKQKPKVKYKTKIKTKTVVKDKREKGKMSFFQKLLMFLLILTIIGLTGIIAVLGYHIYETENIDVPNVIGYTYEDAVKTLNDSKLNSEKIEKIITDESKDGIVINQNKKGKAKENQTIKLTVGILDTSKTVPNLKGLTLEKTLKILNDSSINYQIKYETSSTENIVLKQSISPNKKISSDETLIITVSKKETEKTTEEITEEIVDETEKQE